MIFGVPAMGYPQTRLDGKYLSVLKRLKDCAWKIYLDYFSLEHLLIGRCKTTAERAGDRLLW